MTKLYQLRGRGLAEWNVRVAWDNFAGVRSHIGESCSEPRIRQPLTRNRIHKRIQPIERVSRDVTIVQAKRELVDVACEMFLADLMVDAIQTALEDGPHALDAVRTRHTAHIFVGGVIDAMLLVEQAIKSVIRSMLISKESRASFDVLVDGVLNFLNAHRLERESLRPSFFALAFQAREFYRPSRVPLSTCQLRACCSPIRR